MRHHITAVSRLFEAPLELYDLIVMSKVEQTEQYKLVDHLTGLTFNELTAQMNNYAPVNNIAKGIWRGRTVEGENGQTTFYLRVSEMTPEFGD